MIQDPEERRRLAMLKRELGATEAPADTASSERQMRTQLVSLAQERAWPGVPGVPAGRAAWEAKAGRAPLQELVRLRSALRELSVPHLAQASIDGT